MRRDSRAWVEIDLAALRANVGTIRALAGIEVQLMAIVKANAYGHGLKHVAQEAVLAGCAWLGVATTCEGASLRRAGISTPIALLSPPAPTDVTDILRYRITPLVGDPAMVDMLASRLRRRRSDLSIHIDVETGMGRSGVLPGDAVALWRHAAHAGIAVDGIATHYADAESFDESHTCAQREQFESVLARLYKSGAQFKWRHQDSSATTLRHGSPGCNLARIGLLMYGIVPNVIPALQASFTPVLSLKARIATIRDMPIGHGISYGVTHRLKRRSRVATVLVGYGDGYSTGLSNAGRMLVQGAGAPILGRVCMDSTLIDVTDIPAASVGDVAVCIGRQGDACIAAEDIADTIGAARHEVTTLLSARLPRVYLNAS